jgi:hypothetical protein
MLFPLKGSKKKGLKLFFVIGLKMDQFWNGKNNINLHAIKSQIKNLSS